jgi:hypothetical protein
MSTPETNLDRFRAPALSEALGLGEIRIVSAGCSQNCLLFALLQNDSFIYIFMHERVKQGEKDERGTPPVGAWTMKDLPEKSDI